MTITLAVALALTPITLDGERLEEGRHCYVLEAGGQPMGHVRETIAAAPSIAGPAWSIRVEQLLPARGVEFVDHFLVTRDTLRPVAFHSVLNGEEIARLLYLEDQVVGRKKERESGEIVRVDEAHGGVIEGNLWGATLSAMTLEAGGSYRPTYYQYREGVGAFAIDVTGEDRIDFEGEEVDVWLVAMGFSEARQTTYLIGKEDGRDYGTRGQGFAQTRLPDCSALDALSSSSE